MVGGEREFHVFALPGIAINFEKRIRCLFVCEQEPRVYRDGVIWRLDFNVITVSVTAENYSWNDFERYVTEPLGVGFSKSDWRVKCEFDDLAIVGRRVTEFGEQNHGTGEEFGCQTEFVHKVAARDVHGKISLARLATNARFGVQVMI
jgi:hypothetical protein